MTDARLNEYTKEEWLDVCRRVRPDLTEAEFEKMWADFVEEKRRKAQH